MFERAKKKTAILETTNIMAPLQYAFSAITVNDWSLYLLKISPSIWALYPISSCLHSISFLSVNPYFLCNNNFSLSNQLFLLVYKYVILTEKFFLLTKDFLQLHKRNNFVSVMCNHCLHVIFILFTEN